MNRGTADIVLWSCLGLHLLSTVLIIVAVAITHWMHIVTTDDDITMGLFKLCHKGTCVVYDDHSQIKITDDLKIIRGLVIVAVILYGFALIVMGIVLSQKYTIGSKILGYVSFICSFVGAVLAIAGAGHFFKIHEDEDVDSDLYDYEYSLHLAWASAIPAFFAGLLSIILVNHYFQNRDTGGQVLHQGSPPPYVQNVTYPYGMAPGPVNQTYDNPMMMSTMNSGYAAPTMEKRGPPSDFSAGGHPVSGSPPSYVSAGGHPTSGAPPSVYSHPTSGAPPSVYSHPTSEGTYSIAGSTR